MNKWLNAYLWGYKNWEAADHVFRKFREFYPDGDIFIKVDDNGSSVTAVTFDGSDEGNAIFVNDIQFNSISGICSFVFCCLALGAEKQQCKNLRRHALKRNYSLLEFLTHEAN